MEFKEGYYDEPLALPTRSYISNAKIKSILSSKEHFFAEYAENVKRESSRFMDLGRIIHMAALEPDEFRHRIEVHRFDSLRSKEAQAWHAAHLKKFPNAIVMSYEEKLQVDRALHSLHTHPMAGNIISRSVKEKHGYARCPDTGIILYSRPDIITPQNDIFDLKCVRSVDPGAFNRQQFFETWFMQLRFYNRVHSILENKPLSRNTGYIALENSYPYRVQVFPLARKYEEMGDILVDRGISIISEMWKQDPHMQNKMLWRKDSFKAVELEPERFMLENSENFTSLIGIGG